MLFSHAKKPGAFDAFVHLLTYLALGLSAFAVGAIVVHFINRWVPDLDRFAYGVDFGGEPVSSGMLRFNVASLLLSGPLLLALTAYLHRLFRRGELDPSSGVRRWLTYLVLFLAAGNVIGSIIGLVYRFLGGNYTANFLLKALTVLVIAAVVFGYYLWELKRADFQQQHPLASGALLGAAVIFGGLLAGGFLEIGSPAQARLREFDRRRIQVASDFWWQLEQAFRQASSVPSTLAALGGEAGRDPQTGQPFRYEKLADNRYRLCVTFALTSPTRPLPSGIPRPVESFKPFPSQDPFGVWQQHQAGEVCHDFIVRRRALEENMIETELGTTTVPSPAAPSR